jgi:hypothetical protein
MTVNDNSIETKEVEMPEFVELSWYIRSNGLRSRVQIETESLGGLKNALVASPTDSLASGSITQIDGLQTYWA